MRWVKRLVVAGLLVAPAGVVAAVGLRAAGEGPDVAEPIEAEVSIGPHDATVSIVPNFGGWCMEVSAAQRGAGNCAEALADVAFVFPFGDGSGDAEFAAVGVAPEGTTEVVLIPSNGDEPVPGTLIDLPDRDESLFVAYWSIGAVAPESPRLELRGADGDVLLDR